MLPYEDFLYYSLLHTPIPLFAFYFLCSMCPAYSICEPCEAGMYAHDPNHILLKLRRPVLCVSETYSIGQFSPRLPATLEQVR